MTENEILMVNALETALQHTLERLSPDRVFVLTDANTHRLCWPRVASVPALQTATPLTIEAGDDHKNLATLTQVWTALSEQGATRHSCLVNVGGGMVTDLGGFAASTFKRGIAFVNLPTTLLAMVDASVGGKTGINFMGLKNEIGAFCAPNAVLIDSQFLATLDARNLRSGYAEMLKHALIAQPEKLHALLSFDLEQPHFTRFSPLIEASIAVKKRIVEQDAREQGLRKVLNFLLSIKP